MEKISKIIKSEKVTNNLKQQSQQEKKLRINNSSNFGSMLSEEERKLEEKDKEKAKQKPEIRDIYKVELQKALTVKNKINQKEDTEENIGHEEK